MRWPWNKKIYTVRITGSRDGNPMIYKEFHVLNEITRITYYVLHTDYTYDIDIPPELEGKVFITWRDISIPEVPTRRRPEISYYG